MCTSHVIMRHHEIIMRHHDIYFIFMLMTPSCMFLLICLTLICSKGSCLLTKRQTQPAIMSRFLGMMTPSHSNSITVGMMIKVRDIDYVLKWIYSV